jgi:hypothetical protein
LHSISYCIFLKSLRILEEFRKNSHIKISPKSPYANFQSPAQFLKILFKFERILHWLLAQSACAAHAAQPAHSGGGGCGRPSFSPSRPSAVAFSHTPPRRTEPPPTSAPWRIEQRSTPPSMPLLNSATPPPPRPTTVNLRN